MYKWLNSLIAVADSIRPLQRKALWTAWVPSDFSSTGFDWWLDNKVPQTASTQTLRLRVAAAWSSSFGPHTCGVPEPGKPETFSTGVPVLFFESPDPICLAEPAAKGRGSPPSRPRWRAGRRWGRRRASRRPAPAGLCARGLSARLRPCIPRSSRRSSGSLCRLDTRRRTCPQSPASRWSCWARWWCAEASHPAPSSSDEKKRVGS